MVDCEPPDEGLMKRRLRERLKMQRYRKRLVDEAVVLRADVAQLERLVDEKMRRRRSRGSNALFLTWKEIAKSLEDESELVKQDYRALKRHVDAQQAMALALKQWVAASAPALLKGPTGHVQTWRQVTLCAHPASRARAFEWIAQQLHHNTDRMLQRCLFPATSSSDVIDDFLIDASNLDQHGLQYIWRDQRDVPYSLDAVRDVYARPHYIESVGTSDAAWAARDGIAQVVAADQQMLAANFDGSLRYGHDTMGGRALVHTLACEFNEPNRCVFVAQNIHDDELLPNDAVRRNRMTWSVEFVLERLGPHRTKIRSLNVMTQLFSKDGFVPLEEEALVWGLNVHAIDDVASVERRVNQHIQHMCTARKNNYEGGVREAMMLSSQQPK
ncbi:Aste57867_18911 [Aphanomyces stellatus]|uniref:Aste57867_18911 protein n=1 Tax=Aphanomyces stellatus TaxID=120398 RepID=A0A485LC57_9STRA|nr:hypothetical protein As57867_018847 [Aphanomyces stellatus]VFT95643.1 Aste57867_18911 [Aphanomyces stellatus]